MTSPNPVTPLFPAEPPPPTPQPQLLHSTLRIIVGGVFMLFGLGMGAIIAWGFAKSHEAITVIDGAFVRSESGRYERVLDHSERHVANVPRGSRKDVRERSNPPIPQEQRP